MEHIQEPDGARCLFYIIIDNFSKIRSLAGITASDAILKTIAGTLEGVMTEKECLARFGDHSFIILSQRSTASNAERLATQICSALDKQFVKPLKQGDRPTCSIESHTLKAKLPARISSITPTLHAKPPATIAAIQFAVYDANASLTGYENNNAQEPIAIGEQKQKAHPGSEANIQKLISHALKEDRIHLVFQPVVSLQGDSRENYAVMTRLLDHNDEEILPCYFLEEAEQTGQMIAVDHWIIKHAIQELAQQRKKGRRINFFITISRASITDPATLLMICESMPGVKGQRCLADIPDSYCGFVHSFAGSKNAYPGPQKNQMPNRPHTFWPSVETRNLAQASAN